MTAPGRRSWLLVAGVLTAVLFAMAPTFANAACQPQTLPETQVTTEGSAGGWCIGGSIGSRDQPRVRFAVPAAGLWQVRFEVLPSQLGLAMLTDDGAGGGRQLWQGATSRSNPLALSPPLLLAAGAYSVTMSTGDAAIVYRLRLEPGQQLPADLAGPVTGAFEGLVHTAENQTVISWNVEATSPDELWTASAQASPGLSISFELIDPAGRRIISTGASDQAGVFRLPDLRLAPGSYRLVISGVAPGVPIVVGATNEPADFATEPDDNAEQAHPLELARPVTGRLVTNGTYGEHDYFALTVPAGGSPRRYDVTLSAASAAPLSLALLDTSGGVAVQRDGTRQVSLRDLVLPSGSHIFQVSGALPADVTYNLLAEDAGPPIADAENEPNDVPAAATALPASGVITGDIDSGDKDYLDLNVASGLELWDIDAIGDGVTTLSLYDGAGQVIATASPPRTNPLSGFSHLLLPPGHNVLRVDGTGGSWLLRAKPIGPPVDGEEIEPDDDPTRALTLVAGRPQRGGIERQDDRDFYAFHIAATQRVTISLDAPAELALQMRLSWGDTRNTVAQPGTTGPPGQPQQLRWEGLLRPGDYFIELASNGGISRDAYTLKLDVPSFFDRPFDLEPNDTPQQAVALAAGRQLVGVIQGDRDTDWYALDPTLGPAPLTIRADAIGQSLSLRLVKGDSSAPQTVQQVDFYKAGDTAVVNLPAGEKLLLGVGGTPGPYTVDFGAAPPRPVVGARADLSFEPSPVAAYETVAQRLKGTLTVHNEGTEPLTLRPSAWIGDERWRFDGLPDSIAVAPAARVTIPVSLEIATDARDDFPVYAEVGFSDGTNAPVLAARAMVPVSMGVPPVSPHQFEPFPAAMNGGLDVAATQLGAVAADAAMAGLFDGVVDTNGVSLPLAGASTVQLAGDRPVPISGVILQPPPGVSPGERLADFAIEVSRDGMTFARVLTARLSATASEQAFVLPQTTTARAVRFIPLSAQGGPQIDRAKLAEFAVIAAPDFILQPDGFDIAASVLGGHVVRATGFGRQALTGEPAIWPGDGPVISPADRTSAPQWVLGFLDGRAARIASLTWHERTDAPPNQRIRMVEVSAGADGPLGPWVSLGRWRLDTGTDDSTLTLPTPVWARALSFRVIDPAAGVLALPDHIEVHESPGPSILGAWGDLNPAGPYEAQLQPASQPAPLPAVTRDPLAPTSLALGTVARGQVKRGESENWYAIDLPQGTRQLRADFADALAPAVALALVAPDGSEVALTPGAGGPGTLTAVAGPGNWRLHVTQPQASVVIAWDTSGSVSGSYPVIDRMIRQLAWQLDPDREQINLVPFRDASNSFLMSRWSGDRADVFSALHAYPLTDSSSDSEDALLFSASRLADRVGTRAVVIVTDASYSGVYSNEPLWASLDRAPVGVFALYVPADPDPRRARGQTNLMADWANAAGGHVSRFASQGDGEVAFRRVQAWLNRPAGYAFSLSADTTPPPPGHLLVQLGDKSTGSVPGEPAAASPVAMEIVLDASGSMLQRLGPSRRIDIAKAVLSNLGRSVLPAGLPVALRVFGHDRPDSCDNELFIPLGPLDRSAFVAAIQRVESVNLARTSIAATLRQAGKDLAGVAGAPIIILMTDGNETCGGDPMAEIKQLRSEGLHVQLNIIGFAIDDAATQQLLTSWSEAGGGHYFNASDGDALAGAIAKATALSYTVFDPAGTQVAQGTVGGAAVELPPGEYTVRVGATAIEGVVAIKTGETQTVIAP